MSLASIKVTGSQGSQPRQAKFAQLLLRYRQSAQYWMKADPEARAQRCNVNAIVTRCMGFCRPEAYAKRLTRYNSALVSQRVSQLVSQRVSQWSWSCRRLPRHAPTAAWQWRSPRAATRWCAASAAGSSATSAARPSEAMTTSGAPSWHAPCTQPPSRPDPAFPPCGHRLGLPLHGLACVLPRASCCCVCMAP